MDNTRKMVYMENMTIDGIVFVIHQMERMEYNGQWVNDGYDVFVGEDWIKYHFVGYPTTSDLEKLIQNDTK
jgi:hypothetical protein